MRRRIGPAVAAYPIGTVYASRLSTGPALKELFHGE